METRTLNIIVLTAGSLPTHLLLGCISSEERLAALARDCPEVESEREVSANLTDLLLLGVGRG